VAEIVTDHNAIRNWTEQHGGKPAAVDRTHRDGDVGILRIMFPKAPHSEHDHLVEISWDEFFEEFEQRKLALLYDPESLFSKIIGRDTAERRAQGDHDASRHSRPAGSHREEGEMGDAGPEDRYSLKEREYRDEQGEVHHHTNRYMDQHEKD
jgi:hypothetical protein